MTEDEDKKRNKRRQDEMNKKMRHARRLKRENDRIRWKERERVKEKRGK